MAQTGTVTADALRLRSTPSAASNNNIIKTLPKGTQLQIVSTQDDWLRVTAGGQDGFVSEGFVRLDQELPTSDGDAASAGDATQPASSTNAQPASNGAGASAQPASTQTLAEGPAPAAGSCKIVGNNAVTPDGKIFATRFKLGVFTNGKTSIKDFVAAHPGLFPSVSPSRLRVMQAVSVNEGRLEAVNTWDNAFLTFGCFQWTVGVADGAGELPAMLDRLKKKSSAVFQKYFGQFGLDVQMPQTPANTLPTGFLTLNGTLLKQPAQKEKLRTLDWAYRFWLAGQDDTVRVAEIEHAMSRVDLFFRCPRCLINTRFVGDYLSSEYGVALMLDQHVNRPGHVPGTLARAVADLVAQLGADAPQSWQDAQESKLITLYLQKRAQTSMTNSDARAKSILQAVNAGLASSQRGSFQG
ncbi:MAG: SH3 domain-containing protein [Pyrinomonadaceae bacterium]